MKWCVWVNLVVCVLVLDVSSARARQAVPQPFSADMSATLATGGKATGKFYLSPPKVRMDLSARGMDVSFITDSKTQSSQILLHQQRMFMEVPAGENSPLIPRMPRISTSLDPSNPCSPRPEVTCKKDGTETVNGRECDKWEMTDKKSGTTTAWIDQKLHFPIKTQNTDGTMVEFSNIKEGAQDASLFQVPAGYQKLDIGALGGHSPQELR